MIYQSNKVCIINYLDSWAFRFYIGPISKTFFLRTWNKYNCYSKLIIYR